MSLMLSKYVSKMKEYNVQNDKCSHSVGTHVQSREGTGEKMSPPFRHVLKVGKEGAEMMCSVVATD